MKIKKNLHLLGFITIPIGILLGLTVNKWLGMGIIVCGMAFSLFCIFNEGKQGK